MSDSEIQVINAQTEDNLTGLVIDGKPHLYWLRVYKSFGITSDHATKVIRRLTPGTHYVKFTKEEYLQLSGTTATVAAVDMRANMFYFLTDEGFNRALIEIDTEYMNDPIIAAAIDQKKDEIANIYTRYQQGEILSLAADQHPALPGEVTQPVN